MNNYCMNKFCGKLIHITLNLSLSIYLEHLGKSSSVIPKDILKVRLNTNKKSVSSLLHFLQLLSGSESLPRSQEGSEEGVCHGNCSWFECQGNPSANNSVMVCPLAFKVQQLSLESIPRFIQNTHRFSVHNQFSSLSML